MRVPDESALSSHLTNPRIEEHNGRQKAYCTLGTLVIANRSRLGLKLFDHGLAHGLA